MNTYAIGIICSILLYLAIGSYAGRKIKHLDDFYVAGRGASTLLIVGTLIASFLSTNAFLGETGFTYSGYGPVLMIMTAVNSIGYVLGALFFGRYLRRSNVLTVAEFFGQRFNDRRVQMAAGITIIAGISAYLLAVTQGVSLVISEVMALPYTQTLLIVWLGYTLFTLYSGSRGVVITDTIMFLLFTIVAFVALYFIVDAGGGWNAAIKSLAVYEDKPGIISWHGLVGEGARWSNAVDAMTWGVTLGISWSLVLAVSPWQSSRYLMAKNEHTVIRAACVATGAVLLVYLALLSAPAIINLSNANIEPTERAMIWAALNLMPVLPGVLLMAGITAAGLSSASTFLSLVGFSVSHDLSIFNNMPEEKQLLVTRISMLLVGLVVLGIAFFQPPSIMVITYFAGTLFASSWGPVAFMSIWSKSITANAAFWGIITGFLGNIIPKLLDISGIIDLPVYLDPFIIALVLSITTILIVSGRGEVTSAEKTFLKNIHITPGSEIDAGLLHSSLRICNYMLISGVSLMAILWFFYITPYHDSIVKQGNSSETVKISSLLLSGEFLQCLIYSSALVIAALIARIFLKRSYSN